MGIVEDIVVGIGEGIRVGIVEGIRVDNGILVGTVDERVDNREPVWGSTGNRPVVHCWDGTCRGLGRGLGRETKKDVVSNAMAHTSLPQSFSSKTAGHCTVAP